MFSERVRVGVDVITRSPINNVVEDPTSPKPEKYWREALCANPRAGWHVRGRGVGGGRVCFALAGYGWGRGKGAGAGDAEGNRRARGERGRSGGGN